MEPMPACVGAIPLKRDLYEEFRSEYKRTGEKDNTKLQVGNKTVYQFKRDGDGWTAYSRKYKSDDGGWLTVQAIGYNYSSIIRLFAPDGEAIASISKAACDTGYYVVQKGNVDLVQAALQAVTGRPADIVVAAPSP